MPRFLQYLLIGFHGAVAGFGLTFISGFFVALTNLFTLTAKSQRHLTFFDPPLRLAILAFPAMGA
jgi:hypothetical protein